MQLQFVGKNIDVTPALKNFTSEKLKPLEKRYNHINTIHFVFSVEKLTQTAEATVHLNGSEIHASSSTEDMYQSIEEVIHKLLGQITKYKEKMTEHHKS